MGFWTALLQVVLLLSVGLMFGLAARKIKTNPAIGYLLAGLVLGPGLLNLVHDVENVRMMAELGVALLLFSIGLEFSWPRLRQLGRLATLGGVLQLTLTTAVGFGLARALGLEPAAAATLGAALSLSSTAVVLRVLTDRSELDSLHGRVTLGVLLMQDVALVPLLILISVLAEGKSGLAGLSDLGFALAKAAALISVFYVLARWVFPRLFQTAFSRGERDFPIVLAASVCGGCTWAAHSVGLSPALGAFTAGILLAGLRYADQVRADMIPLRSIFSLLFFASIGMLGSVPRGRELLTALLLTLLIVAVKTVVVVAIFLLLRQPFGVAIRAGLALAQIGEFSFVLAQEAYGRGLLPQPIFEPLLTASLLSLLLSPYLIQAAPGVARFVDRLRRRVSPPETARATTSPWHDHVLVIGYGPAGSRVADQLRKGCQPFLVLEMNADTVARNESLFPILLGDATSPEILTHAGIAAARAVVVTLPDPGVSSTVTRNVRLLAPNVPVIARGRFHIHSDRLTTAGAQEVVDEEDLVGAELARALFRNAAVSAAHP